MSYTNATMCDTDTDHLTCPRCGYAPEAEYIYVGAGCSQDEPVTVCAECGWDIRDEWACSECGCSLAQVEYDPAEGRRDEPLCEECRAEVCVPS